MLIEPVFERPSIVLVGSFIFVDINDHYDLTNDKTNVQTASAAVAILETDLKESLMRSSKIIDRLMALTEECRR
jgi:hypothetical protein